MFTKLLSYMFPAFFKIKNKIILWHFLWAFLFFPFLFFAIFVSFIFAHIITGSVAFLIYRDIDVVNDFINYDLIATLSLGILTLIFTLSLFWLMIGFIVRRPKLFKVWLAVMVPFLTIVIVWMAFTDTGGQINDQPLVIRGLVNVAFSIAPALMGYWLYSMVIHEDKDFDVGAVNYSLAMILYKKQKYFWAFVYLENLAFKKKHRLSLDFLGGVYETGRGKELNRGYAFACYEAAFDLGHESSMARINALKPTLSSEEIEASEIFKKQYLD